MKSILAVLFMLSITLSPCVAQADTATADMDRNTSLSMQTLIATNMQILIEMKQLNSTLLEMKVAQDIKDKDAAKTKQLSEQAEHQHQKELKARRDADKQFWAKGAPK